MTAWTEWLPWGRHALYVGGSLALCLMAVAVELWRLKQRHHALQSELEGSTPLAPRRSPTLTHKGNA